MSSSFIRTWTTFLAKVIAISFFFSWLIFKKFHAKTSLKYRLLILGHILLQKMRNIFLSNMLLELAKSSLRYWWILYLDLKSGILVNIRESTPIIFILIVWFPFFMFSSKHGKYFSLMSSRFIIRIDFDRKSSEMSKDRHSVTELWKIWNTKPLTFDVKSLLLMGYLVSEWF